MRSATQTLSCHMMAEPHCHFCNRAEARVKRLAVYTDSNICDRCVDSAAQVHLGFLVNVALDWRLVLDGYCLFCCEPGMAATLRGVGGICGPCLEICHRLLDDEESS